MVRVVSTHRRIQDFVRGGQVPVGPGGGGSMPSWPPLDPRLTIWGSNLLWGGGALGPPPWIRACYTIDRYIGLPLWPRPGGMSADTDTLGEIVSVCVLAG